MDSNRDSFFQSIEAENIKLSELVTSLESEVTCLNAQVSDLEKALDKQKKLHRKYAEEVEATENSRIADFKEEKRALIDQNKLLVKENRQLNKDLDFYKRACEELTKEDEATYSGTTTQKSPKKATSSGITTRKSPNRLSPSATKSVSTRLASPTATSSAPSLVATSTVNIECSHKSSKALTKLYGKVMLDNKKLKSKTETLNATIKFLKAKSLKLENFKQKIDNKKLKFSKDKDELERLIASTEKTNEQIFTPAILAKLGELSKYKVSE